MDSRACRADSSTIRSDHSGLFTLDESPESPLGAKDADEGTVPFSMTGSPKPVAPEEAPGCPEYEGAAPGW